MEKDIVDLIGNTPLIKLKYPSEVTGCNIYGKAEFLNPAGSVKDRTALGIILDAEERKVIGPWLNKLVKNVAKSSWKDRQDNKAYLTSYITLIWGLMVNDLNAVQNSIDVVKLAIHDMRPDGSFPIDTQRSGMGIKYNADSYGYLLMISSLSLFII